MSSEQRNALRRLQNLKLDLLWLDACGRYVTRDQAAESERIARAVNAQLDKNYGVDSGF